MQFCLRIFKIAQANKLGTGNYYAMIDVNRKSINSVMYILLSVHFFLTEEPGRSLCKSIVAFY